MDYLSKPSFYSAKEKKNDNHIPNRNSENKASNNILLLTWKTFCTCCFETVAAVIRSIFEVEQNFQ